jgi:hypothetical protein
MIKTDVIILGAGAAGMMCAIEAGKRQRQVLVLDHANKPGKKILMSGGGRCNFTNLNIRNEAYISHNPHFFKSALSRYTQWDFIELVKKYHIAYHEKKHGQLFCDDKAKDILNMLLQECQRAKATVQMEETITAIEPLADNHFNVTTNRNKYACESLVVATGGLSIPTLGASPLGYKIAEQFGLKIWPVRAGLVPLTLHTQDKEALSTLSGVSQDCLVSVEQQSFRENILFTHRGLSGPAILQISNYWEPGQDLIINLLPEQDLLATIKKIQRTAPKLPLKEFLGTLLPKRLLPILLPELINHPIASISQNDLKEIVDLLQSWTIKPNATEGYRTAEVTMGGVDTNALSSKTMECNEIKGLYFIGEVVDVTGWLGGYNFQWAWSSGWAAGQGV